MPRRVMKAEREHFGHKRSDLAAREIHHSRDLFADQVFGFIEIRDLRRRFLDADVGAEVYFEFVGRLARFGEGERFEDGSGADIHLKECLEIGLRCGGHVGVMTGAVRGGKGELKFESGN